MANGTVRFETFDVTNQDDIGLRWKKWMSKLTRYFVYKENDDDAAKINELFLFGGYELEEVYTEYQRDDDDYDAVILKLTTHFNPTTNLEMNRFLFHNIEQLPDEPFSEFVTKVKSAALVCQFNNPDNEIKSQLIHRCQSETLKVEALKTHNLTLAELINKGRADESIAEQIKKFRKPSDSFNIQYVQQPGQQTQQYNQHYTQQFDQHSHREQPYYKPEQHGHEQTHNQHTQPPYDHRAQQPNQYAQHSRRHGQDNRVKFSQKPPTEIAPRCKNCNFSHPDRACPAYGKTCNNCGKSNHFASKCRSKPHQGNDRSVQFVSYDVEPEPENWRVWTVQQCSNMTNYINRIFMPTVMLFLCQTKIEFNIDTGSQVDIMDEETYNSIRYRPRLEKCNNKLYGYSNDQPIGTLGKITTRVSYSGTWQNCNFIVTKGGAGSLLSYKTCVLLGILNKIEPVMINAVKDVSTVEHDKWAAAYPELFSNKVGSFNGPEVTLHIDENVRPRRDKLRPVPFHLREGVEKEIHRMLEADLIEPVTGPTPWISPIVPVPKKNGTNEIRICSDARYANKAIQRQRHIAPTVEDLVVNMNGAKFISKLDLKGGYNQLVLDPASRYITAFCTHMGVFRYKRLNFGINTSGEIFQKVIEGVLNGLEGVVNMSDDCIVFGATEAEHDARLKLVLERLEKNGFTLNTAKCEFKVQELDFFRTTFWSQRNFNPRIKDKCASQCWST